jgi:hypothetical protein
MTNTQRTLKALKDGGYLCGMVERFNQYAGPHGIRQDLFGIIDIIAIKKGELLGVQSTGQAFAEHDRKILASENLRPWLESGARFELWGWRKVKKKRGGKAMVWKPRIKEYRLGDVYDS